MTKEEIKNHPYFMGRFNKLGPSGIGLMAVTEAYNVLCEGKVPVMLTRGGQEIENGVVSIAEASELLTKRMVNGYRWSVQNWGLFEVGRAMDRMIRDLPIVG